MGPGLTETWETPDLLVDAGYEYVCDWVLDDQPLLLNTRSGPIVSGQACEFDYSGVQACKALRGEGYRVVLVNSNPATIMTDPELADVTYIEPLTVEILERIIER